MLTSPIRQALGAYLGQVLTPDVAAAIELAACAPVDESFDPERFGSVTSGDYTIQVERFADVLDEMHALHVMHWSETEKHRAGLSMRPDYLAAMAQERAGRMIQFTVRHAPTGELVGNLRMYLAQSTHTQTPYAQEDTLYLKPAHRGGFTVMALIRFAESALRSIGIPEIRIHSKLVNNADVLMRRMKYQPVALEFVKFLRN